MCNGRIYGQLRKPGQDALLLECNHWEGWGTLNAKNKTLTSQKFMLESYKLNSVICAICGPEINEPYSKMCRHNIRVVSLRYLRQMILPIS